MIVFSPYASTTILALPEEPAVVPMWLVSTPKASRVDTNWRPKMSSPMTPSRMDGQAARLRQFG
jgi:hypothetical protein